MKIHIENWETIFYTFFLEAIYRAHFDLDFLGFWDFLEKIYVFFDVNFTFSLFRSG